MPVREYNGQRVVTFKDIDTVHGNKTDTSKRNFNRNKKHFIDGEDFVVATRENLKRDKLSLLNIEVPTRGITLLTESGYLLIAKSFTDDLSWKVQRELVNTYFQNQQHWSNLQFASQAIHLYPKILAGMLEISGGCIGFATMPMCRSLCWNTTLC
mgnify:CR=1 FL=1